MAIQENIIESFTEELVKMRLLIHDGDWDVSCVKMAKLKELCSGIDKYNHTLAHLLKERLDAIKDTLELENVDITDSKIIDLIAFIGRAKGKRREELVETQIPDAIKDKDGEIIRLG